MNSWRFGNEIISTVIILLSLNQQDSIAKLEINPPLVKIQEIFPEGVANHVNKRVHMHEFVYKICKSQEIANLVNKLVHAHSFVYLICNSLGKYFLYFKPKVD